jgi:hypothetical protein
VSQPPPEEHLLSLLPAEASATQHTG